MEHADAPAPPAAHPLATEGAAPTPHALRMAWLGLIPFAVSAALIWLVWPELQPHVTLALVGYAGAVVAFLGGIHWGLAMRQPADAPAQRMALAWSAAPPLVASIAMLMPPHAGLVVLGAMLLICYGVDRRLYASLNATAWLTLRFRLSVLAALACFIGAAGS